MHTAAGVGLGCLIVPLADLSTSVLRLWLDDMVAEGLSIGLAGFWSGISNRVMVTAG